MAFLNSTRFWYAFEFYSRISPTSPTILVCLQLLRGNTSSDRSMRYSICWQSLWMSSNRMPSKFDGHDCGNGPTIHRPHARSTARFALLSLRFVNSIRRRDAWTLHVECDTRGEDGALNFIWNFEYFGWKLPLAECDTQNRTYWTASLDCPLNKRIQMCFPIGWWSPSVANGFWCPRTQLVLYKANEKAFLRQSNAFLV